MFVRRVSGAAVLSAMVNAEVATFLLAGFKFAVASRTVALFGLLVVVGAKFPSACGFAVLTFVSCVTKQRGELMFVALSCPGYLVQDDAAATVAFKPSTIGAVLQTYYIAIQ